MSGATLPWGVNVVAALKTEAGIAEAARRAVGALDAAGVPLVPAHPPLVPPARQGHPFPVLDVRTNPFAINLICVNALEMPRFMADVGADFFDDRHSIGFWLWEVENFPAEFEPAFAALDEVWAPTEHVAKAIRSRAPVAVRRMRIPLEVAPPAPISRERLAIPAGFVFLFSFSYFSVAERKNPLAVIEAFGRAFEPGEGPSLVVKCVNPGADRPAHARLLEAAGGRPDVHVIDRYFDRDETDALTAACDCYVSLHRAEGLGLGLAEAMSLGKPVIATRYSGNLEFMTDANGYLVDCRLRPIGEGHAPYPAEGEWAEPDVEHAAALMREVFDDPARARERGRRARDDFAREHSREACGAAMRARLEEIGREVGATVTAPYGRTIDDAPRVLKIENAALLLERGPLANRHGAPGRLRDPLRRLALRAIGAHTAHQRRIDESLVDALSEAHGRAWQLERRMAGLEQRLAPEALVELRRLRRVLEERGSEGDRDPRSPLDSDAHDGGGAP